MIKEDAANPHQIENIDDDKFITELDPDIWKAICLITQPLSHRAVKSANNARKIFFAYVHCFSQQTVSAHSHFIHS